MKCKVCGKDAWLSLNNRWLCLACFDAALKVVAKRIRLLTGEEKA